MKLRLKIGVGYVRILQLEPFWTWGRRQCYSTFHPGEFIPITFFFTNQKYRTEHGVQAKRRQARLEDQQLGISSHTLDLPVKIPGIHYVEVNIHGRKFEMNMLWKLSFYNILYVLKFLLDLWMTWVLHLYNFTIEVTPLEITFTNWSLSTIFRKVITFIAMGYRLEGASILVKEAIQPRGLYGLAYDTLDYCGAEISHVRPPLRSTHPSPRYATN